MNEGFGTPIRNVALVSSAGAGKTSLAEAMLFTAGATTTLGTTAQRSTVSDFDQEEHHRQHSLSTSVLQFTWNGTAVTLLDTPGDRSFQGDVIGALRAVDTAIVVVSATVGPRPDLARLWGRVKERGIPALLFVTDMDKDGASLEGTLAACRDMLETAIVPLSLPAGRGVWGEQVLDLVAERLLCTIPGQAKVEVSPVPATLQALLADAKKPVWEAAAETDDARLELYLAQGALPTEDVVRGLTQSIQSGSLVPAFCGSALHHLGIVPLLDAIVAYCPAPGTRQNDPSWEGIDPRDQATVRCEPRPTAPFSGLVFKTSIDPFMGRMSYVRVWSGTLTSDGPVFNATRSVRERGGHLYQVLGKKYLPVPSLSAGQIGAIGKLKDTQTGETLCDEQAQILYPSLKLPRPVLSMAIEPRSKTDVDKVSVGLHKIVEEDPTLEVSRNEDTKELVLSGLGQLHLEVALDRLRRKYGVDVQHHPPRVPYRETIRHTANAQGKYKKQTGGHGQYGDCWLQLAPQAHGQGFRFENKIVGGAIPRNFIPAIEKGVVEAMREGILAGYPVVDVQVTVYDGSYHVVDSSEMAFKIAASMGFKKAMESAHPVLLEPLMHVVITCPDDHVGAVIGDLNGRRGRITTVTAKGHTEQIDALVPLAEMLTYAPALNGLTGGRGEYSMEFAAYEEVPADLSRRIVEETRASRSAAPV